MRGEARQVRKWRRRGGKRCLRDGREKEESDPVYISFSFGISSDSLASPESAVESVALLVYNREAVIIFTIFSSFLRSLTVDVIKPLLLTKAL